MKGKGDTMPFTTDKSEVDALALRDALRAAGIRADWFQTGGNTGTMYCGPEAYAKEGMDSGPDYRFPAALIGPGNYGAGTLSTWELSIGPDESYDPTAQRSDESLRLDGEPVDLDTLVAEVRSRIAESVRRWKADPNLVVVLPDEAVT